MFAGVGAMGASLLLIFFDSYWEPIVYAFLQRHAVLNFIVGFVPYLGNLALFVGIFLVFKAKQRPSVMTENEVPRDGS
jgi:hypothetical protein